MLSLALNYRGCMKNMKSSYIQGHDAWIDGASIQVASTKELQKTSDRVRKNLNLSTQTLNNEETRQNELNDQNNHIKIILPQKKSILVGYSFIYQWKCQPLLELDDELELDELPVPVPSP